MGTSDPAGDVRPAPGPTAWWRDRAVLLTAVVVAVGIVLAIGSPLVGGEILAGTDALEGFDPWRTTPPDLGAADNPLRGDEIDVGLPSRRAMAEGFRAGEVPLWQSTVNGGRPLAALPNSGSVTPFDWPYFVLPYEFAPAASKVLELLVAIAGTMALLRRWGVRRDVALLAGFLVSMTGFQIAWTGWSQAHVGALLPWMLWATDVAVRGRLARSMLPLAGVVAVAWLEGFPSMTLYGLLVCGVYALVVPVRQPMAEQLPRLARAAAGVVLGTGLAAFQLLPFAAWMGRIDLSARTQTTADDLPFGTLLTTVLPDAFGDVATWRGVLNYVEVTAFVGVVAVALAGLALVVPVGDRAVRPRRFLVVAALVAFLPVYVGGPFLGVLQRTPLFALNDVGRLRSVLLLALVALAAVGLDGLLRRDTTTQAAAPDRPWGLVRGLAGGVVAVAVAVVGGRSAWSGADAAARDAILTDLGTAAVVLVGVVVLLVLARRRPRVQWLVVPGLAVLAVVEVVGVTTTVLPRAPDASFYPVTEDHRVVTRLSGDDRFASGGLALYPGTTSWYDLRTVAGHAFPTTEWRDALEAVDPDVYRRLSTTLPVLGSGAEVATSPLLDRLAARAFVNDLAVPLLADTADPADAPPAAGTVRIGDQPVTVPVSVDRALRGIAIEVTAGTAPVTLHVAVRSAAGEVAATGQRRFVDPPGGVVEVGVEEVDVVPATVEVWTDEAPLEVAARDGLPAVSARLARDDGLRLAAANGTVVYERLDALPRHRWASRAVVDDDPASRLSLLASGALGPDEVVLHAPRPELDGEPANVRVVDPDGDRVVVEVSAQGAGMLVVADSMQEDWRATVDGREVAVVPADHVGVAVPVPAGTHEVVLTYHPAGWRAGLVVSGLSLLAALGVAIASWRRARGTGPASAA